MDRLQLNTKEGEGDPYLAEYSRMSAPIVKLMLRSLASASQMVKMHVIRQWVAANTLYHVQVRTRDNTCDNQVFHFHHSGSKRCEDLQGEHLPLRPAPGRGVRAAQVCRAEGVHRGADEDGDGPGEVLVRVLPVIIFIAMKCEVHLNYEICSAHYCGQTGTSHRNLMGIIDYRHDFSHSLIDEMKRSVYYILQMKTSSSLYKYFMGVQIL